VSAAGGACRPGSGEGAGHDRDIPADWARSVSLVAEGEARRVVVIGPPDAGKTSLCRAILRAAAPRRRVALLDGDAGQKMVGPPACVTLGRPTREGGLALRRLAFVGTTDPVRGWARVVEGIRRLAASAGADILVVNTGGLVAGPGRALKEAKIEALAPDLLLALGRHPALDELADAHPALPCLRLATAPGARRKGEGERRRARREAFHSYFADAGRRALPRALLRPEAGTGPAPPLPPGLLVGLGGEGRDEGLGLVLDDDPAGGAVTLLTPVAGGEVVSLRAGELLLGTDFRETRIGRGSACGAAISPAWTGARSRGD